MLFGKKEKDINIEEKLKEIEQKVKGMTKKNDLISQSSQAHLDLPQITQEQEIKYEKPKEEKPEEETRVPLFIKLEKYKTIVSSLMQLKTLLISLKNSLMALEQIEKTRMETFSVIIKNLEKMSEKLSLLEKELVKPFGFPFGIPEITYSPIEEMQSVQASVASLKAQIDQLKAELESQ
jgi:hypothetical protein